jgi:ParB-like chromosome segregation protein Spo0J
VKSKQVLESLDLIYEEREVSLDQILIGDFGASQVRTFTWNSPLSRERIEDFVELYRAGQTIEPLIVEEHSSSGDQELFLLAGNHRYRALRKLNGSGPATVNVLVITAPIDDLVRNAIGIRENSGGSLPMMHEEVDALILSHSGLPTKRVAEAFGLPATRVSKVFAKVKMNESLAAIGILREMEDDVVTARLSKAVTRAAALKDHDAGRILNDAIPLINSRKLSATDCAEALNAITNAGVSENDRLPALAGFNNLVKSSAKASHAATRRKSGDRATLSLLKILQNVATISPVELDRIRTDRQLTEVAKRAAKRLDEVR